MTWTVIVRGLLILGVSVLTFDLLLLVLVIVGEWAHRHDRSVDRLFFVGDDGEVFEVPSGWVGQACELHDLPEVTA